MDFAQTLSVLWSPYLDCGGPQLNNICVGRNSRGRAKGGGPK